MKKTETNMKPDEAAAYIAAMTADLHVIAKKADLNFIAYILEMAYEEAYVRKMDLSVPTPRTKK